MTTARPRRIRGPLLLLAVIAIIVTLVVTTVVVPTLAFPPETPKLDDHGELPPFRLVDNTGAELTNEWLRGHVTVVNFIFTRCKTVCPVTTAKMATIQARTADKPSIRLLSISVDPAHDSVAVLDAFATTHRADPTRWLFARGDVSALRSLVEEGMHIGFEDRGTMTAPDTPDIVHSGHFVLVDQDLHVRGYYDSDDWPRIEKMMKHARYLTRRGPAAAAKRS